LWVLGLDGLELDGNLLSRNDVGACEVSVRRACGVRCVLSIPR
jgi:hypothetical protein